MKFRESGAAPCCGYGSACLEDRRINRSPYSIFLENCPGSRWSRSQRILAASLGTELPARWAQGSCSTTTPFRKPISLSAETNGLCTEASCSYTGTKGTCKDSSCTVNRVPGCVTGYKGVSTVGERTLMSAVAWQPVSIASESSLHFNHTVLMC